VPDANASKRLLELGNIADEMRKAAENRLCLAISCVIGSSRSVQVSDVVVRSQGGSMPDLAKDIIEEFMQTALHYARHCALNDQELDASDDRAVQDKRDWKRNQFKGWARLAVGLGHGPCPISISNLPRDLDLASDRQRSEGPRHHGAALAPPRHQLLGSKTASASPLGPFSNPEGTKVNLSLAKFVHFEPGTDRNSTLGLRVYDPA